MRRKPFVEPASAPLTSGSCHLQLPVGRAEAAALEAAAALAVAVALVRSLPKFLSPYLPALLEHTLNPLVSMASVSLLHQSPPLHYSAVAAPLHVAPASVGPSLSEVGFLKMGMQDSSEMVWAVACRCGDPHAALRALQAQPLRFGGCCPRRCRRACCCQHWLAICPMRWWGCSARRKLQTVPCRCINKRAMQCTSALVHRPMCYADQVLHNAL